ncbi:MAG: VRR-NUC domain-containing protein [Clostridia bacterium]|nr:VRR-NUC domain-containing protein [Clostridia bacterium]
MTTKAPMESSIVNRILKWLNQQPSCQAEKTHGGRWGRAGKPDITGCYRGRRFELEVKRPGARATKLQLAILKRWKEAGAITAVVTNLEEVKAIIKGDKDNG